MKLFPLLLLLLLTPSLAHSATTCTGVQPSTSGTYLVAPGQTLTCSWPSGTNSRTTYQIRAAAAATTGSGGTVKTGYSTTKGTVQWTSQVVLPRAITNGPVVQQVSLCNPPIVGGGTCVWQLAASVNGFVATAQ